MAMTDHSSEAPPTYLRLSPASWAEVGEAYVNGATAKELAALWKTSPSSIYRHAGLEGWTKKAQGDAVARAHVAARRAEAQRVPTYPGEPGARPWPKPPPEGYPDDGGSFIDWRPTREAMEREHYLMFRCIAFTALAMLHKPQAVHPMLMRQVYAFRRDFLGETDRAQIMKNASILTERILLEVEDFAFERVDVVNPDTGVRERLRTWPPVEPPFPDPDWTPKPPRKTLPSMPLFRGKRVSA
jgi:hypothetical protein